MTWFTAGDHFTWWCAENCVQFTDVFDGQPLAFEDWQTRFMDEAMQVDEAGRPRWLSVALIVPRKNGKTTMLAAYALYNLLEKEGYPEILLSAASDKQAGRLFDAAAMFCRINPVLLAQVHIRDHVGEIARADGGGKILRMSSSPERLHGYNPSLVIADEVAQWTTPSLRRAWAALTTAGGARQLTQTFTISVAGEAHERHEGILGRMLDGNEKMGRLQRDGALTISRHDDARTLIYNYCAATDSRDDVASLLQANPASWITEEYLARQAANPELSTAEVLQFHGCVWTSTDDTFFAPHTWDALEELDVPLLPDDVIAVGFDGSRFVDSTGFVGCRLDDGQLQVLGLWERPEGTAGRGWEVPADQVEATLDDIMNTYRVMRVYLDPPYWQSEIMRWQGVYGDKIIYPWQTARMTAFSGAVERFHTDGHAARFHHDGDPRLRRHVLSAKIRKTNRGLWIEKVNRHSPDKMDLAVASVLAYEARCDAIAAGETRTRSRIPLSI